MANSSLRVRINHIDQICLPTGPLDKSPFTYSPIVRIFGSTPQGEKACVHIHQVYPYFLVEYDGDIEPRAVNDYILRLKRSLNHTMAASLNRHPNSPTSRYIRGVFLVKGVHFYGFHSGYSPFLKIYVADPSHLRRMVDLMQAGSILQTRFKIFESHLGSILQFMCDFSLYGCGWLDLGEVHIRGSDEDGMTDISAETLSLLSTSRISPHGRVSRMPIEVDVAAHQILNRHAVAARVLHDRLRVPAPPQSSEPLVHSVRELWEDERNRRQKNGLDPSPEIPLDPSENSRGAGSDWAAEARWWDEIRTRIERERFEENVTTDISSWEPWIMTTFESIEALWEKQYQVWKPARRDGDQPYDENPYANTSFWDGAGEETDDDEDDVGDISSWQELSQVVERGEAEWARMLADDDIEPTIAEQEDEEEHELEDIDVEDEQLQDLDKSGDPFHTPGPSASIPSDGELRLRRPLEDLEFQNRSPRENHKERDQTPPSPTTDRMMSASHYPSTPSADRTPFTSTSQDEDMVQDDNPRPKKMPKFDHNTASEHQLETITIDYSTLNPTQSSLRVAKGFVYSLAPPTAELLTRTWGDYGLPDKVYQEAHYSIAKDAPERAREFAGLRYRFRGGQGVSSLDPWVDSNSISAQKSKSKLEPAKRGWVSLDYSGVKGWEYASSPPSRKATARWIRSNQANLSKTHRGNHLSQIRGPTQTKFTPPEPGSKTRERQNMTVLSLELFVPTRPKRVPDSQVDQVVAVFYSFHDSDSSTQDDSNRDNQYTTGIVVLDNSQMNTRRLRQFRCEVEASELDLLNRVIDIVVDLDPDIITGWEIQAASWGYLSSRGKHYGFDFEDLISRAPSGKPTRGNDQWSKRTNATFAVSGRHVLNLSRIMRSELKLHSYTFEHAAFHTLDKRIPYYSFPTLTKWYNSASPAHTAAVISYFASRTSVNLDIMEAAETVTKTSEFARVFGIDFNSVLFRGSQFNVESFMFRIAKPESYVLLSPSKADVGKQNAAECMPLVMEPLSAFYKDPVVVLDFASLYPSIMIAYNYCYSTCLGRIRNFQGRPKFGVTELQLPPRLLETFGKEHIHVAANGVMYATSDVRRGLLGRMLTEMLQTRVMVKQAMKGVKQDKALKRVLNARQLGLKFIANVTYGYTSATYSGRMPAVEIADSIVQSGRESLEKAIRLINSTARWGAKVVYGDTDSLFIHLPGKTKDAAFRIGHEMADTVTALNPAPIKLKFEKVYLPCVLMAKKKYVGFKYEYPDEVEPVFDAKGIETVRRDGVPAQRKMLENCLKILFRTQDLSQAKAFCWDSWMKILEEKVSLQDFIYAKEVKMGTYSDKITPLPGVALVGRRVLLDANDEVPYGDRVPYVIVRGPPRSKLNDRTVDPLEVLEDSRKHLDASYYISHVLIPPLERVFNLLGADVRGWFDEMPKTIKADHLEAFSPSKHGIDTVVSKLNIDHHFRGTKCLVCSGLAYEGICEECRLDPQITTAALGRRIQTTEKRLTAIHRLCTSCTGLAASEAVECISLDCAWLFERNKLQRSVEFIAEARERMQDVEENHQQQKQIL